MRQLLLFLISIPEIIGQIVPSHESTITERVNYWNGYGYGTRNYYTRYSTPLTRFSYAANAQPGQEGYKYVWDNVEKRYRLAAQSICDGDLVDYVWGQPRFLCNCGMFGGISYQIGWCNPVVPDPRRTQG